MGKGGADNDDEQSAPAPLRPGWMKDPRAPRRKPEPRRTFRRRREEQEPPQWPPQPWAQPPEQQPVGPHHRPGLPPTAMPPPPPFEQQPLPPDQWPSSTPWARSAEPEPSHWQQADDQTDPFGWPEAGDETQAAGWADPYGWPDPGDPTHVGAGSVPPDADDNWDEPDREPLVPRSLVLGWVAVVMLLLVGVATLVIVHRGDDGQAAAEGRNQSDNASETSGLESTTTSPSSTSTSSTSTSLATTTTTVPETTEPAPVVTAPPTTPPTTVPPTTAPTTTTTRPAPAVDAFNVDIDPTGCGPGRSPGRFSWATTNATSVTLGKVPGSASGVAADGQSGQVCIDDDGETWRLTATGPGGTVTRDLRAQR